MTLNGVGLMALILRYFAEFGSFWGALRKLKRGWRCRRKKVHVRYLLMSFLYFIAARPHVTGHQ